MNANELQNLLNTLAQSESVRYAVQDGLDGTVIIRRICGALSSTYALPSAEVQEAFAGLSVGDCVPDVANDAGEVGGRLSFLDARLGSGDDFGWAVGRRNLNTTNSDHIPLVHVRRYSTRMTAEQSLAKERAAWERGDGYGEPELTVYCFNQYRTVTT